MSDVFLGAVVRSLQRVDSGEISVSEAFAELHRVAAQIDPRAFGEPEDMPPPVGSVAERAANLHRRQLQLFENGSPEPGTE